MIRLYQVKNTSSCKITEVKQLGPQLALGWVTIQVSKCMLYCNPMSGETGPPKHAPGAKNLPMRKKQYKIFIQNVLYSLCPQVVVFRRPASWSTPRPWWWCGRSRPHCAVRPPAIPSLRSSGCGLSPSAAAVAVPQRV